jgi:hypothetical protein
MEVAERRQLLRASEKPLRATGSGQEAASGEPGSIDPGAGENGPRGAERRIVRRFCLRCSMPCMPVESQAGNQSMSAGDDIRGATDFGPRGGKATAQRLLADADTTRPRAESDTITRRPRGVRIVASAKEFGVGVERAAAGALSARGAPRPQTWGKRITQ